VTKELVLALALEEEALVYMVAEAIGEGEDMVEEAMMMIRIGIRHTLMRRSIVEEGEAAATPIAAATSSISSLDFPLDSALGPDTKLLQRHGAHDDW